ncbi:Periplasmic serine protease (ClpP class) [Halanaeroarchaeum sp. HSR-CO]|uniref:S49 family peptidase n=1 Tax=Halanaeroarchaeum sp. HSR-CO TaxID=2866382 RepID=UPI00217E6417|nr:S49 family peptidase [Halanaeroarchaeum sp. HSR-CO]UWG46763.1 Periplasmic serine protease (ClpP class) [Halanaeroarchaeum sp. HSR-CO]
MSNRIDTYLRKALSSYAVLAVIAIVLGAMVVPPAINAAAGPDGTVAVVTIDEPITGGTADQTVQELREIRQNDSIDAVVLRVDSGGGGVTGSEAQYRAVKRLAAEKPVVTSVRSMAASGAYYTILPSDEIYAQPSSMVGHVGVIASFGGTEGVPASMTSGPDKASGATADEYRAQLETLKQSFVGTVVEERGEEITLSRTEISQAKIYTGAEAATNGYVDEVGGIEMATNEAASQAGLDSYETTHRDPASMTGLLSLLGAEDPSERSTSLFATPGVDRVRYLAIWGTPTTTDSSTEVLTNASQ